MKAITPKYLCASIALACAGTVGAATLEERVEMLEQKAADQPAAGQAQVGNTQLSVGGFIKADTMVSKYSDGELAPGSIGRDFMVPSTIPVGGEASSEEVDFNAKQSRFWLKSKTQTDAGEIGGHIEVDFQTNGLGDERISNSYAVRLRHAYLTWDKWLFGQTWSTFFNVSALPETLDFVGAAGTVFERQQQIRYTNGGLMLAMENPSTTLYGGSGTNPYDDNAMPDLVARYNFTGDWGNVSLSAMGREIAYQDTIGGVDQDESEYGYAVSLAGKWMLGKDDVRFQANYGNAMGRYTTLNAFRAGQIEADGSIDLIDQWSAVLALRHHWNDQWRSNIALSVSEADNPDTVATTTNKTIQSAHANLIWQVAKPLSLGGEFIYADREIESGDDGDLKRLQFTAKYAF
ncbi:hypothetical protein Y5S_02472 [Alcanivorax nanhaiticus]|uniref:Porin n=1 Tax=Alcanivorax nanhaiticus TaxID=1177154 RepID=A0A095UNU5_9GAMM|nr:DcaP family trimeric outer membrane transporter [Alcanivorax nanhaiticus]KGD64170.1 hypothetical protein Y5S_02472 [Alcanivorax nanhaiticus]